MTKTLDRSKAVPVKGGVKVPQVSTVDPKETTFKCFDHAVKDITICRIADDKFNKAALQAADTFVHCYIPQEPKGDVETAALKQPEVDEEIDALVKGFLSAAVKAQSYTAKDGCMTAFTGVGQHFSYAALVPITKVPTQLHAGCESAFMYKKLGNCGGVMSQSASKAGANIGAIVNQTRPKSLAVSLKGLQFGTRSIQSLIEGIILSITNDDRFKSKPCKTAGHCYIQSIRIYVGSAVAAPDADLATRAIHFSRGIDSARQLVSAPPNYCNPASYAQFAESLAARCGMKSTIYDKTGLEAMGMGAFLGVGKGSFYSPHLVHLTYTGELSTAGQPLKKLAFVGKGLTTDTGGYNLKVGSMIELMKFDMGGSAAVFGAAQAVAALKPKGIEVNFILGIAENMVSDKAFRPGDILTASNGTTINIDNTDAEGRLVLCDCLVYAESLGVDFILDIATLTGSCIVGLGGAVAGLYGTHADVVSEVLTGARDAGERLWPMPLQCDYQPDLDHTLADLTNAPSTKMGGTITAALFLSHFVKKTPWCHVDMAGPTWDFKTGLATGFGVRTITEFCCRVARGEVSFPVVDQS